VVHYLGYVIYLIPISIDFLCAVFCWNHVMAGIEDAGYTLYTVQSGEFFPTSDSDNSFPPLTTSFTFASGCVEQWRIVNPDFPTEVLNSVPSSCFPGGRDVNSPGTCLPSYRLVALGEFKTPGWTSGGVRAWGADCCRKYVYMLDHHPAYHQRRNDCANIHFS
jgi:hypothetical protein